MFEDALEKAEIVDIESDSLYVDSLDREQDYFVSGKWLRDGLDKSIFKGIEDDD